MPHLWRWAREEGRYRIELELGASKHNPREGRHSQ